MPLKLVYTHRTVEERDRMLEVRADGDRIRLACDAPGVAAVGHELTWQEWDELVAAVDDVKYPHGDGFS